MNGAIRRISQVFQLLKKKPRQIDVVLNYSPYERSDSTNFFNFGENLNSWDTNKFWNTL